MTETQRLLRRRQLLQGLGAAGVIALAGPFSITRSQASQPQFQLSDAEWRARLSPAAYAVLRHAATEKPYSSPLNGEHRRGTFVCKGCGLPLFSSRTKFNSRTGWPSFFRALPHALTTRIDRTLFEERREVLCARCGGHLGHVFGDGPQPTGLRYCINGVAMRFLPL